MVSKLVLAVQESSLRAMDSGASDEIIGKMLDHYYEMQAGIGVHKSPELYGAVPTDPYSHTPATKGAQQPGMTGQVKEDILSRIGELGAFIKDGKLSELSSDNGMTVHMTNGTHELIEDNTLNNELSQAVFSRTHQVQLIEVKINHGLK